MSAAVRAALLCACAMLLHHASAELIGRCPASAACPARASPCAGDDECGEQVCCDTACGKSCVDPLFTGCENIKLSSERISRALAAENSRSGRGLIKPVRTPRCRTSDGEFEEIQCDNEIVSSCWCVDQAGFEVPGTRAPAAALVNCTRKAPCAAHTCRMLCPLGFELDNNGCPLCKCRDPCNGVTCPGQLSCQLDETPCLRPPCPPVPNCKRARSLQNICPAGEPLLISETSRPFLCGTDPGKPNCPPLYKCLVESGNDYGVCCPASLALRKAGTCPAPTVSGDDCGTPCAHDLECPSMEKCCDSGECGKHCILPQNVTMCNQQKMLAELLVISEKEGRGYVPQCAADGSFESRQCSRNGLVCWCVDTEGNKLRGSMGPSPSVHCSDKPGPVREGGRSLNSCPRALCAGVCEYGYKSANGCPTCECDDPCEGYPCADGEECIRVRDADCTGELCTGYPVCRPRVSYENPCEAGVPATDDDGSVVGCGSDQDCPNDHLCTRTRRSGAALCCPDPKYADNSTEAELMEINYESCGAEAEAVCDHNSTISCADGDCEDGLVCCSTINCGPVCVDAAKMRLQTDRVDDTPTMCEYLRDFDEKMEGTVDGMKLALPAPTCTQDGSFSPQQCAKGRCWCVDSFGTEIPETSTNNASSVDCEKVREQLACLDLTCRMGCDYGFELGSNRCPTCRCRDPCGGVTCPEGRACAVVDVACDADYCPPVPACLPRKPGQCPFLVPHTGACEWACRGDAECGAGERCCATGCGTACAAAVHHTPCQQRRALALHTAAESGKPPSTQDVPDCKLDGSYEPVQCRKSENVCWCVDNGGNEVPGTRAFNATPSCETPTTCPEVHCNDEEICAHGRQLDDKGCPTCECRDLCAEAKCRDDETCELVPLECEAESCPPIVRCTPSPRCPEGSPLLVPGGTDVLVCGPSAAACPSTHACRFAPHDTGAPVCCPKPRTVCFDGKDEGNCTDTAGLNATRWHFNHERNRCERFKYNGCSGNHNNFRSKEECNAVCPANDEDYKLNDQKKSRVLIETEVLSPCERLREKNEAAEKKYGKGTFIPKCDVSGAWESVQCMSHIDVCWCVSARGEPLKGSLVRGARPSCNFRQARKWAKRPAADDERARADEVLEELIRQMTAVRVEELEEYDDLGEEVLRDEPVEPRVVETLKPIEKLEVQETEVKTKKILGGTDVLVCGPSAAACPSTHACRFAPHDTGAPVCCPKPRTVCFDGKDEGNCTDTAGLNATRWHFNHERNRCERFKYNGCSGNHNNFRSKEECNAVCPANDEDYKLNDQKKSRVLIETEVLSPCERLREKNEAAEKKYGKGTFIPKCDVSGAWESVQCMSHIDVCWCVSARGEPLKGSLVRGARPSCNFRQARKWAKRPAADDERARADEVLEELIRQMTAVRVEELEEYDDLGEEVLRDEPVEPRVVETLKPIEKLEVQETEVKTKKIFKTKCQLLQEEAENGGDGARPRCLADGSFAARQCSRGRCWCVDAAGQRRGPPVPDSNSDPCVPTQIESASLELEIVGTDMAAAERARNALAAQLVALGARVPVTVSKDRTAMKLRAVLAGPKAVDIVYHVENLVKQEKLSGTNKTESGALGADVIRSEYRLAAQAPLMQQREILSESTVSATTSYHTALIVLAASSAFVISVLCVLVMLYRGRLQREPQKAERFLPPAPPVYVLSADEKAELARALHAPPPPVPPQNDHTRI